MKHGGIVQTQATIGPTCLVARVPLKLEPNILKQIEDLGLRNTPNIWLTNNRSVHISIDFPYMVEEKISPGQVPFCANKLQYHKT